MATSQSTYISVEAYELKDRRTASSSVYKCTVSRRDAPTSHYGYCQIDRCLLFTKSNWNYFMMWGFPSASQWKSSWGKQSWILRDNASYDIGFGWLPSTTVDSYTWEEEIKITRPANSKQGSKTVYVGQDKGSASTSDWGPNMVYVTLYTTKIGDPTNLSISTSVDDKTKKDRKIKISASFGNTESFYSGAIYEGNTKLSDSLYHEVPIKKSMYGTTKTYKLVVTGKDGSIYNTSTTTATIEASGVGVWVNKSGTTKEIQNVYYKDKNGNIKDVTELWVRKNTTNYETVK